MHRTILELNETLIGRADLFNEIGTNRRVIKVDIVSRTNSLFNCPKVISLAHHTINDSTITTHAMETAEMRVRKISLELCQICLSFIWFQGTSNIQDKMCPGANLEFRILPKDAIQEQLHIIFGLDVLPLAIVTIKIAVVVIEATLEAILIKRVQITLNIKGDKLFVRIFQDEILAPEKELEKFPFVAFITANFFFKSRNLQGVKMVFVVKVIELPKKILYVALNSRVFSIPSLPLSGQMMSLNILKKSLRKSCRRAALLRIKLLFSLLTT